MPPSPRPCLSFVPWLCFGLSVAHAQTEPTTQADGRWRGTGGASVSASSGNSESTSVLLHLDMTRLTAVDKATVGGAYNCGRNKTDGVTTLSASRRNAFGQYDYDLGPRSYAFGKLGLEADELARLELRVGLSGGLD